MEKPAELTVTRFMDELNGELSSENLVFPTSINAAMKIRQALNNPDISNNQVARIISTEPVLSAQVLKICNSVMYSRGSDRITDLRLATLRLGYGIVRNVAISVGMKQLAEHKSVGRISRHMEALWTRSVRVAALSFVLAKNLTRLSPDSAMIAGLLHDIGKFYILNRARRYEHQFLNEHLLWEFVDQWHVIFCVAILKKWQIEDDIRDAIRHCGIADLPTSNMASLSDVITAAGILDACFIAKSSVPMNWESTPPSLKNLALDQETSENLMEETKEELRLVMQAIS